jgi:trk system potassium uptake protein TrkA
VIVETEVVSDSYLAGRLVSEVAWPQEAVLVAIERDGSLIVPRGDFRLRAADLLSVFATPAARTQVEDLLAAPGLGPTPGTGDGQIRAVWVSDR